MGGKGYKSYTSLTGKKISGDWEDSDRGACNKATRRAGGEVKAKSPTYIAHVINKGKKKVDPKKNPAVKEHHQTDSNGKVIEHPVGDGTPSSVEEDYYKGTGKKVVARTRKWMKKKGQEGAPGLDAMKARTAEHKAKRGVKEEVVDEGLGAGYAIGGIANAVASGAKAYGASQAAKGAIIGGALSGAGSVVGGALNYAASRNKNKKSDPKKKKSGVKEDFIGEVNTENENPNANEKKIDVMKGKNKIKINPNVGEQVEPNKINDTNSKDPVLDRKEKRVSMMKRQILQKKMQAVRSGGGADIVAHNEPKGGMVEAKVEKEDPRSMGTKYRNIKNRLRSMGVKFVGPASRLEEEDKAFNYVLSKLKKKHGDGVLTKRDKIKPQSSADKAKARAHQAKVDAENAAERKKDPSQGRYPKGYSNRGSD